MQRRLKRTSTKTKSETSETYTEDSSSFEQVDVLFVQECKKADSNTGLKADTLNALRSSFRQLKREGYTIGFANLVPRLFEKGKSPVKKDILAAFPKFKEALDANPPKFLITLGATVTKALTGKDKFKQWVGRLLDVGPFRVVPIYHPDYAYKTKQAEREYTSQVQNVVNLLSRGKQRKKTDYHLVSDESSICRILDLCSEQRDCVQAFDWETECLEPHLGQLVCLNLSIDDRQGYCLYWYSRFGGTGLTPKIKAALIRWMKSPVPKVAHHAKFEIKWAIYHLGVEPNNLVGDTKQMFHLINELSSSGLKDLAYQYTDMGGYDTPMQEFLDKGNKHCDAPPDFMLPYAAGDGDATRRIYLTLREEIKKDENLTWLEQNIVIPGTFSLARIETRGMRVDFDRLAKVENYLTRKVGQIQDKIENMREVKATLDYFRKKDPKKAKNYNTINFNSPDQVKYLLYTACKLPVQLSKDKKPTTDKGAMANLEGMHPVIDVIVEQRSFQHDLGLLESMKAIRRSDDTVYSDYVQDYVVTGRLASRGLNLQNLPSDSRVKECITSRFENGLLLQADWNQLELRLIGGEAMDDLFIDAFTRGLDIHTATAVDIFKIPEETFIKKLQEGNKEYVAMRTQAKRINFGVVYGITKYGLARQLKITVEECETLLEAYWKSHPKIERWMKANAREAYENFQIANRLGRIRHIPDIRSDKWWVSESAERIASNSPIQSLGADITMWAMANVDGTFLRKGLKSMIIGQIHDSLLADVDPWETQKAVDVITNTMEGVANRKFKFLRIPLTIKVETGFRWSGLKEYKKESITDLPF